MEKLNSEMVQSKPQSVADRVDVMLKNGNLTKNEREEILAVIDKMKASKEVVVQQTISKLENFAKQHGYTGFEAKLKNSKANIEAVTPTQPTQPTESGNSAGGEVENVVVTPTQLTESGNSAGGEVENVVVTPTESPKETISSKYINDSIKKVEDILKKGIQAGEEEDLTILIKELQDKKVLKTIPGILDGKLKKGQDLISVGEDVVDRLEKIAKNLETAEDNKKDLDEKTAKNEAKKAKDKLDTKSKKEKEEIEKFETDLGKIDMTSIIKNLNSQIEAKNNLQTPDVLEEQVGFQDKKDALKSKLDKVKLSSDNKTLSDLTGTTSVEKDDKGNITLKFNLDPKGLFDKFDSSKTYNVKLSSTNLDSQKSAILGEVEKAYSEQISDLTK